jgi:sugar phosphate isomerase/epimerase
VKIGIFSVGLPHLTPEEGAHEIAKAGYGGVEWRVTHVPENCRGEEPSFWRNNLCTLEPTLEDAARARRLAEREGLRIAGLGTYIEVGDLGATEEAMQFARRAGAPQLRVGVGKTGGASYAHLFDASAEFLLGVEALAREYGVKALVEIHHGTICPSASLAYRLVSRFDPEAVGVIYDPGNMAREGFEDYRIGTEILGPYLAHVHLKNAGFDRPAKGGAWKARWAPLEDGVVDFDALFDALSGIGYDGWLVVEDFSRMRPDRQVLRHNLGFVRDLAERL